MHCTKEVTGQKSPGSNLPLGISHCLWIDPDGASFMVLGQSAAIAASIAIDNDCDLQNVRYEELKLILLKNKQVLQ